MAGDGTSRVNTEELLRAVGEITSIKKSVAANTDAAYAHFANCRILMQEKALMISMQWRGS